MQRKAKEEGRQEGSRWINRRPTPEEFAKWFRDNVKIHEGLDHGAYLSGITLIPNKEKVKEARVDDDGTVRIVDVEQLVYTPYPKVETRELYFWDWCEVNGFLGEVEQLEQPRQTNVPPGFFHLPVTGADGRQVTHFIGASVQVRVFQPDLRTGGKGRPTRIPQVGTKVVPLHRSLYGGRIIVDENAVHKAQTGAAGRALGYAGMLIVPGAGIATAEDMQELLGGEADPVVATPVQAAGESNGDAGLGDLAELVAAHRQRLESEFPQQYEEARAWCHEKGYSIDEPPENALRGLERALRRKLEEANHQGGSDAVVS